MTAESTESWNKVKSLLDDPYVPDSDKVELLAAYIGKYPERSNDADSSLHDDVQKYAQAYSGAGEFDTNDAKEYLLDGDSLEEALEQAEESRDLNSYHSDQQQDQVDADKAELEDLKELPSLNGVKTKKSDDVLDKGKSGLDMFKVWIEKDKEVPGECRGVEGPLNFQEDIVKRYDEQRGIGFDLFIDEALRFKEIHGILDDLNDDTESKLNSIYKEWQGQGANKSYDKYSNDIVPNVNDLLDHLEEAPEVIERAVQGVYRQCWNKADEVLELYTDTMGSASPELAEKVIKYANAQFDDNSRQELEDIATWLDRQTGSNVVEKLNDDDCDLNDETKEYVSRQCKKWITESFNPDFYGSASAPGAYLAFKQSCDDTLENVDNIWEKLSSYMSEYENEFSEGDFEVSVPGGRKGDALGGSQQPVSGGTGPQSTTGSGGGGEQQLPENLAIPTSEGAQNVAPEDADQEMFRPDDDQEGRADTDDKDEQQSELNTAPRDSVDNELENDEQESGEPTRADFEKTGDDFTEELRISHGDNEIVFSSPDDPDRLSVVMSQANGDPIEFMLNFDGEDRESGEQQGTGQESREDEAFGPLGVGESEQDMIEEDVYRPGDDGKIHLERDDIVISAERPEGVNGATRITIDDGEGDPTTYTLGSNIIESNDVASEGDDVHTGASGESNLTDTDVEVGSVNKAEVSPGPQGDAHGAEAAGAVSGVGLGTATPEDHAVINDLTEEGRNQSDTDPEAETSGPNKDTVAQSFFDGDANRLDDGTGSATLGSIDDDSVYQGSGASEGDAELGAVPDGVESSVDSVGVAQEWSTWESLADLASGSEANTERVERGIGRLVENLFGNGEPNEGGHRIRGSVDIEDNWFL